MPHRRIVATLLCVAAAAGCSSGPAAPVDGGGLDIAVARPYLSLTNRTAAPAFTFVVGRSAAASINWAPCVDADRCPPIAPGATRRDPYPLGLDGARDREAIVHWWHAVPGPGGAPQPDSIRAVVVGL